MESNQFPQICDMFKYIQIYENSGKIDDMRGFVVGQ